MTIKKAGYTLQDFFNERDELLNETQLVPSPKFCETFIKRLPDEEEVNGVGYYNDASDYHAWGKSLTGDIDIDGEGMAGRIKVWNWVSIWESLKNYKKEPNIENQKALLEAIEGIGYENDRMP